MNVTLTGISHYHHRRSNHPRPSEIPWGHERVELMTDGRGWIIHEGEFREVLPGDLIWQVHGDRTICRTDPDHPYVCLSVNFKVAPSDERPVPRVTRWDDKSAVNSFIKDIIHSFHEPSFDIETLGTYVYSRLLFQAQKHLQHHYDKNTPPQLIKLENVVQKRYREDLRVEDLAALVNWSAAHLHDQCKKYFDASPLQLIVRHRINHAKEQLCSHRDTVKSIAADCGFNSASHFCRSFKQHVGMSPEQFRRSYWER